MREGGWDVDFIHAIQPPIIHHHSCPEHPDQLQAEAMNHLEFITHQRPPISGATLSLPALRLFHAHGPIIYNDMAPTKVDLDSNSTGDFSHN